MDIGEEERLYVKWGVGPGTRWVVSYVEDAEHADYLHIFSIFW